MKPSALISNRTAGAAARRGRLRWWHLALLWWALPAGAAAQVGGGLFLHQHYTAREHKAHPVVWSVAQHPSGILFFANNEGVLSFDGARWKLYPTPNPVRAVAVSPSGRVLVGCLADMGFLALKDNGDLEYRSLKGDLPTDVQGFGEVLRILPEKTGAYYLTDTRIYYLDAKREPLTSLQALNLGRVLAGTSTGDRAFVATRQQGIVELSQGAATAVPGGAAFAGFNPILLLGNPERGFYLVNDQDALWSLRGGNAIPLIAAPTALMRQLTTYELAQLPSGQLAVATSYGGVLVLAADGSLDYRLDKSNLLPDNDLYTVFADQAGSLWVGHKKGLTVVHPQLGIRQLGTQDGNLPAVARLAASEGTVYAATANGVLRGQSQLQPVAGIGGESWDVLPLAGQVLVANNSGLYAVQGGSTRKLVDRPLCYRLAASGNEGNQAWVGFADGILRVTYENGSWRTGDSVRVADASYLAEDAEGRLWVGSRTQGLQVLQGGKLQRPAGAPADGLAQVNRLGDVVVVYTKNGYARTQGDRIVPEPDLTRLAGRIGRPLDSRAGRLLLTTEFGLRSIRRVGNAWQMDSMAQAYLPATAPTAAATAGDDIVAAYDDALYAASGAAPQALSPMQVVFEELSAGAADSTVFGGWRNQTGKAYVLGPEGRIALNPELDNVRIRFAAATFLNPAGTRYRYRLGTSANWSAWSPTAEAVFPALEPGSYNLQVQAMDALGRVSAASELGFRLVPPFYQSPIAYALYGLLGLVVLFFGVRLYVRRVELEKHRLELVVHERTREVTEQKRQIEAQVVQLNAQNTELDRKNTELDRALTELRTTQDQLLQSEKMAALGQLVAGVAHEINTPVGIGVTAASHLELKTRELRELMGIGQMKKSDLDRFLGTATESSEIILKNLDRAAELIQSFKKVAVDQSADEIRTFKLGEYLNEVLVSLRPKYRAKPVEITLDGDPDLTVHTSPSAISQITINMVVNAIIHAFKDGAVEGKIHIRYAEAAGGKVEIRYADTGVGMPPDVAAKVFDPFFTTNRGKGGSGLGLHIAYNLAAATLRGKLQVESVQGQGTTFILTIPKQIA